ncbi:hypothetical protein [Halovenus halobia]|uniref:hypothetical protein n=1 Tax=Halovenus halobia TaxID=3396622 RepID=UPI003F57D3B2
MVVLASFVTTRSTAHSVRAVGGLTSLVHPLTVPSRADSLAGAARGGAARSFRGLPLVVLASFIAPRLLHGSLRSPLRLVVTHSLALICHHAPSRTS